MINVATCVAYSCVVLHKNMTTTTTTTTMKKNTHKQKTKEHVLTK
jgi:hypothetical protein